MKKKAIVVAASSCFAALTVTAAGLAGTGILQDGISKLTGQGMVKATEQQIQEVRTLPAKTRTVQLAQQVTTEQDFVKLLESQGLYEDEINTAMSKLIRVAAVYSLTENEINQLYTLVRDGYGLNSLLLAFEFTMDTDHPRSFSFAKQLYDEAATRKIVGKNWLENAYNFLTNGRDGILAEEDVQRYLNEGITIDDIGNANLMSRNGKMTIQEILNEKMNGKAWSEITAIVYADNGATTETFADSQELGEIYTYAARAILAGKSVNEAMTEKAEINIRLAEKNEIASAVMQELKIATDPAAEEIVAAAQLKLPGVEPEEITRLLKEGYTIREMEQAEQKANPNNLPLDARLR